MKPKKLLLFCLTAAWIAGPPQLGSDGVTYAVQGSTDLPADPPNEHRSSLDASTGPNGKGFLCAARTAGEEKTAS